MANSALIVLDDEALHVRVFGLRWLEYVIRSIAATGINHVVVVVEQVPRELSDVLDRLRRSKIRCTVTRSSAELAGLFHPQDVVLLIGGTAVLPPRHIRELVASTSEYLLCSGQATGPAAERIDTDTWWTGYATISGVRVSTVASAPGDWNAASILLRSAVQAEVVRELVAPDIAVDPSDAASLAAFERRCVSDEARSFVGWGSRFIVEPAARLFVRLMTRRLAAAAMPGMLVAVILSVAAVLAAVVPIDRKAAAAAICVLLAEVALAVWRLSIRITCVLDEYSFKVQPIVTGLAGVALIALSWSSGGGEAHVLPAIVLALTWLCQRAIRPLGAPPRWWTDVPGQAALIAVATSIDASWFAAALAVAAMHAFACLVWSQQRVSELLSQSR